MHLGLVGGIGPAATEYYYRGLVKAYATADKKLELTIVHADAQTLLDNLARGDTQRQADIFLKFVERLMAAGADAAVITSLAGHFCIEELKDKSPLPIIDALPELDNYFASENVTRLGLLGTQGVMESHLYGGVTSVDLVLPQGDDLKLVHENYIAIAMSGMATGRQKEFFHNIAWRICKEQGADAVALVGTDLFLAFDDPGYDYRVIDCAQVHINALVASSLAFDREKMN